MEPKDPLLAAIGASMAETQPASDELISSLLYHAHQAVTGQSADPHTAAWCGRQMPGVLRRLLDAQAEITVLREQLAAARGESDGDRR